MKPAATSRSTPAARWGCSPPTFWRRFRRADACRWEMPKPHPGQAQWRVGRKGAKANTRLGRGGPGRPPKRDGASGKGLAPVPLPGRGRRIPGAWSSLTRNPQAQPFFPNREGVGAERLRLYSGDGTGGGLRRTTEYCEFIKVLTKVKKSLLFKWGPRGEGAEGPRRGGESSPAVSRHRVTRDPPGPRLARGGEIDASARQGLCVSEEREPD